MNNSGFQDLLNTSVLEGDFVVTNLILPNLDPNSVPYIDSTNTVSDIVLSDGQLVIGTTSGPPSGASLTGTVNQINVFTGPASIILGTPQDIDTTSSPTFNNMTLSSLNSVPISQYIITPSTSDLNMNSHSFTNVTSLNGTLVSNYLKTPSTVNLDMNNHYISNFNSLRPIDSNVNIGNSTSIALGSIGNIVLGDFTTASANNAVCIGLQNTSRGNSVAIGKETVANNLCTVVGYRSITSGSHPDSIVIGHDNISSADSGDIFGVNQSNNQANTLLLGNGSYSNIRATGAVCDLGTSSVPFKDIYSNSSLYGTVNNRLVNDVISNTSTGVLNNLCSFVSDKVIKDSGIAASSVVGPFLKLDGTTPMTGDLDMNTHAISNVTNLNSTALSNYIITPSTIDLNMNTHALSNVTTINSKTADDLVTSASNGSLDMVCTYAGTSKAIKSSGTLITDLATTAALTAGLALKVAKAGDSMSGTLNMTSHDISNIVNLSGPSNSRTADNILSCSTAQTTDNLISWSSSTKVAKDSLISAFNVITDSGTATLNHVATYTASKTIHDSGILSTNLFLVDGTVAMTGVLNQSNTTDSTLVSNGSIVTLGGMGLAKAITAGGLIKSTLTTDSTTTSTGCIQGLGGLGIAKQATIGGLLRVTQTSAATISTDGSVNTLGGLSTSKNIICGDTLSVLSTTDSTSSTSGGLITASGMGIAKRLNVGTQAAIGVNRATALSAFEVVGTGGINVTDGGAAASVKQLNFAYDTTNDLSVVTSIHQGVAFTPINFSCSNIGVNGSSFGSGYSCIFLANATNPTSNPVGGGLLYVNSGASPGLYFRGSGGTITRLAIS